MPLPNDIFPRLLTRYGEQHWWPADTAFEVMVGAVLTQATAWTNVEYAIARLKDAGAMSPSAMRRMPERELAALIYSSGFYNAKAQRLKALAQFLGAAYADDIDAMRSEDGAKLRRELLAVKGVGEETADAILLYALGKPMFVIDAYARRLAQRLGIAPNSAAYSAYQRLFADNLPADGLLSDNLPTSVAPFTDNPPANGMPSDADMLAALFAEYHALIVAHGKHSCRKTPICAGCCLLDLCPTGQGAV